MLALREHISKYEDPVEAEKHSEELKVGMRHFEEAMKKIRPLSSQELSWYKRIAEQFGKPRLRAAEAMRGLEEEYYNLLTPKLL